MASYNVNTIKVYDSKRINDKGEEPGNVVKVTDEGLVVQAEGGRILMKRIETQDGKRMPASAWASQAGIKIGCAFDSSHV